LINLLKVCVEYIKANKVEMMVDFLSLTVQKERMLSLIQKIQSFVTLSISSNLFDSKSIENSLRVLDVFNKANENRILKCKIDYREFYNDAINKEVSLKDHILRWIEEKEKAKRANRAFDKYSFFSLCAYPWILDAANKSEVMKYSSRANQAREINNSYMNIMSMLQNPNAVDQLNPYLILKVNRNNLLEDTLKIIDNSTLKL
jgi:hypothetical protein